MIANLKIAVNTSKLIKFYEALEALCKLIPDDAPDHIAKREALRDAICDMIVVVDSNE